MPSFRGKIGIRKQDLYDSSIVLESTIRPILFQSVCDMVAKHLVALQITVSENHTIIQQITQFCSMLAFAV